MKSKLEELIEKFCPNGAEYRELGEVCKFQNGFAFKSSKFLEKGLPIVRIANIVDGKISENNLIYFDKNDYNTNLDSYIIKKDRIVIAMSGATTGKIGYNYSEIEFYLNQRVGMFIPKEEKLNNRFLYHWLIGQSNNIYNISSGTGAQPNLSSIKMMKLEIPIPPLEIQEEIVRILDKFTELTIELTTELTTELTLRKQQYEHYRDELLNKAKNIKIVTLDMISENYDSQRKPITSGDREKGNIPYYGASGIVDYINDYIFDGDYLLISEDGANLLTRVTPIAFSISGKTWVNNHAHVLKFSENITRKYVEIYLNSIDLKIYITGAAQPKLNQKNLNSIKIPLPPLEEQKRIVEILDRFDKYISDIKEELPAEIEMRQKQYEHYRKELLDFKKLNMER